MRTRWSTASPKFAGLVEKPKPEEAPSNLAIIGRYILTPEIFDILEGKEVGAGGEIQITDAMARLLKPRTSMATATKAPGSTAATRPASRWPTWRFQWIARICAIGCCRSCGNDRKILAIRMDSAQPLFRNLTCRMHNPVHAAGVFKLRVENNLGAAVSGHRLNGDARLL
jgi:hypothetical protein